MAGRQARRALERLLRQRAAARRRATEIENRIFKLESAYLGLTAGMPITRSIEYYLSSKVEKKKTGACDCNMLFATEHPRTKDAPL